MNLDGVIDSLDTGTIEVERQRPVAYVQGNAVQPAPTIFTVERVNVQPATPRDLLRLPENDRSRETIIIFTAERLEVSSTKTGRRGDVVRWSDRRYEVTRREDWAPQSGHFRCWAQKVEEDR